jgi:hypothetical protein
MASCFINKYGIKPHKTDNINFKFPFELIPNKFIGSFLRGFIDGDGSFESHKGTFTPSIVGGSPIFIKQIGDIVSDYTGLVYKFYSIKGKTCDYYVLRWSANRINKLEKIQKFYDLLYNNDTISLKRKKNKIVSYLEYRANQIRVKGIWQCNA